MDHVNAYFLYSLAKGLTELKALLDQPPRHWLAGFSAVIQAGAISEFLEGDFVPLDGADESELQSSEYRQQIAESLYRGIAKYRDESKHTKVASAKN